jgi:trimethylamine:corrinoid methyltransferase-like protein
MVNDLRTGEHRERRVQDAAEIARLVDALPHVNFYEPAVAPADVPTETGELHATAAALSNTSKHVGTEAIAASISLLLVAIAVRWRLVRLSAGCSV